MTVRLIATLQAKAGFEVELKETLRMLVRQTLEERGCLHYQLNMDLADRQRFIVIESWQTREDLEFHQKSSHFKALLSASQEAIAEFTLVEIEEIS